MTHAEDAAPNADALDVLVVGAGPTGLILCHELARRGLRCELIEKRAAPSRTTRAFTLHARTMEMFDHIGIAARIDELRELCPGNLFHFKDCPLEAERAPVLDFRLLEGTAYNYYGKVNQCDLDRTLRETLAARYSLQPRFGVEYLDSRPTPAGDGVEAEVRDVASGARRWLRARWLVGTDGSASAVRASLGAGFEQRDGDVMTMSMVDAELDGYAGDASWVNYHVSQKGFMLVTRLPGGWHRLYLAGDLERLLEDREPQAAFQAGLDFFGTGARIRALAWSSSWQIRKIVGDCYQRDRRLLCGDATHVHSPAGGQGMNACMQDAFNLGWKLALVCRGRAAPEVLASYPAERRPIAQQVTEGAERMHQILFNAALPIEERFRLTQDPDWHASTIRRVSGLSHNYRGIDGDCAGLTLDADAVQPGDRAPDCVFSAGAPRTRLYDALRHPGFTYLVHAPQAARHAVRLRALVDGLAARHGALVKFLLVTDTPVDVVDSDHLLVDAAGTLAATYGMGARPEILLVRPDLYVGFRGALEASAEADAYLARWLC